jgi:hypothetical protein
MAIVYALIMIVAGWLVLGAFIDLFKTKKP